jgi:CBS domain-containing protein
MKLVKHLLVSKGIEVWSVNSDDSVLNAIKMMAAKKVGALLVIDGEQLAGIVSERDYARKVILEGKSSEKTPVKEIMSKDVICTMPDHSVHECMEMMTEKHIRHLPVLEAGKVVGMISIGDLVKAIIAEQQFEIEQLSNYISG